MIGTSVVHHLHERSLRIIYKDKKSTFHELLNRDGSVSIHHENIQKLSIVMYNFIRGLSPELMKETSQFTQVYVLYKLYLLSKKLKQIRKPVN